MVKEDEIVFITTTIVFMVLLTIQFLFILFLVMKRTKK